MSIELNYLKTFVAVARSGSFTKAAKILRVQQPTISKTIAQLEEQLAMSLFERHRKGIQLTKIGGEVLQLCENIFTYVDEIASITDRERTECHGLLPFAVTDSVSSYVIPEILANFLRIHPKVRPSVFAGSSNLIGTEIRDGRVEFGLYYTTPSLHEFQVTDLVNVPFKLVGTKEWEKRWPQKPPLIISRDVDYPKAKPFPVLEMLQKANVRLEVTLSSNSLEAQKQMVMQGLGVALLPGFMLRQELASGQLMEMPQKKRFSYSLKLVTKKRKVLSKNALVFLDQFRQEVGAFLED